MTSHQALIEFRDALAREYGPKYTVMLHEGKGYHFPETVLFDNLYRDASNRLWRVLSATDHQITLTRSEMGRIIETSTVSTQDFVNGLTDWKPA